MKLHTSLYYFCFYAVLLCFSTTLLADKNKREDREPEAATGFQQKKAVIANEYMISAANPYASKAGLNILKKGGSAIDAAVAVQAMLSLVEPQSSGLGGGSFMLYWDNENKKLYTYDGRETAPLNVNAYLFMQQDKPMKWRDAVVGGRSVGVPGALKSLEMAHNKFGKLAWDQLFEESAITAEQGFVVSARLDKLVGLKFHPGLQKLAPAKDYFYPNGQAITEGTLKTNKPLAGVLRNIASQGTDFFYKGKLANKMALAAQNSAINPGLITADDFARYQAVSREPVCGRYKQYKICGMAPPSSGGINVLQILKSLEGFDLHELSPTSAKAMHLYTQSTRLAYADRSIYIADTDFYQLPFSALVNPTYLKDRAKLISTTQDMGKAQPGNAFDVSTLGVDTSFELPNTSHFSIVDAKGNAVSMTTSIEFAFGSGLMVEGFLLNNQLTDFSLNPSANGKLALNRVEPNKRPRSAMSPTMVFDQNNELMLVIGSPGGSRIVSYVAQTLIGVLDWQLNIQQAINLPKVTNRNDYTALEKGTSAESYKAQFEKWGHEVKIIDLNSGLHGIQISNGKLIGGADPRREGIALGE